MILLANHHNMLDHFTHCVILLFWFNAWLVHIITSATVTIQSLFKSYLLSVHEPKTMHRLKLWISQVVIIPSPFQSQGSLIISRVDITKLSSVAILIVQLQFLLMVAFASSVLPVAIIFTFWKCWIALLGFISNSLSGLENRLSQAPETNISHNAATLKKDHVVNKAFFEIFISFCLKF